MKMKVAAIVLLLLALGLGLALVVRHNQAVAQKEADEASIRQLSNACNNTSAKLNAQLEVNTALTNTLQSRAEELEKTTKQLEEEKARLAKTEAEAAAAAEAAKVEIAKRETKIAELETQNVALDKQATDLKAAIGERESRIAETQRKLAAAEGDKEFLIKELKRLQAEKAELERQFNDLVVLREQVKKLKEELAISKRIEWLKKGLYGSATMKGAERLQRGFGSPATPAKTNFDLNVEIKRDGSAPVVSPTNAPAPAPNR